MKKETIRFVITVYPSGCPRGKHGSHKTNFLEMWYTILFQKSVEKIQDLLNSDKNNRYFISTPTYVMTISCYIFLEWEMSQSLYRKSKHLVNVQ